MKHQPFVRVLFLALLACAAAVTAFSQTAQVTGRISDQSGAVVPGAQITLTNPATSINREAVSNDEGYFTIPLVQPGEYRIAVKKDGFKPVVQSGITLNVEQVARLDFALELGTVTEVVNVEAAAPLLEKENSTLGTVVDNKRVTELPLLGRNPYSLVNLLPGARAAIAQRSASGYVHHAIRLDQRRAGQSE